MVAFAMPVYPRPGPRVVEATARLDSGAKRPVGAVELHLIGERDPDGPDRIAVLDGSTAAALVTAEIPAEAPAELVLEGVPVGRHAVVAYRDGESPRWRYATRVEFELDAGVATGTASTTVELDVTVSRAVVSLEAVELPPDRPWTSVTGSLVRPEDPTWSALLLSGPPPVFEPGRAKVELEFDSLGVGRYELRLVGFEADSPIAFETPLEGTLIVTGRPR